MNGTRYPSARQVRLLQLERPRSFRALVHLKSHTIGLEAVDRNNSSAERIIYDVAEYLTRLSVGGGRTDAIMSMMGDYRVLARRVLSPWRPSSNPHP